MFRSMKVNWLVALAMLLSIVLVACGGTPEDAVNEAVDAVQDAAETVSDSAEEVVDAVEETVDEAMSDEESMEEDDSMTEESMEEEAHSDDMMGESAFADVVPDLDGLVVKFWHQHSGGREEELIKIIDDFNATNEYGIVVEATNEGGYGDIYDKMIAGLTTGDVPGLVVAYQNQAASYQVAEGLVPLDAYINDPVFGLDEASREDFFDAFLNADRLPQFGGESYGFPPNRSMEVMYYNATWLAELGYDGPPTTPAEFNEMACAAAATPFSQNPDASKSVGYQVRTDASSVAALTFARGGDIYDYNANQFNYNTSETAEALSMMADLISEGCASLIAERFGDQTDFGNGQTLFTMGSSSGLPFYGSAVDDGEAGGFEWSVAPIPYTGANPVQNIYGASVSIPATDAATQLGAWLFLKHYTSPAVQAGWAQASNYFPTRASVAGDLGDYFGENPAYEVAFELLKYGKTEAPVSGYDNIRDEASAAFSRILDGEDAGAVLAELDANANQILVEASPDDFEFTPISNDAAIDTDAMMDEGSMAMVEDSAFADIVGDLDGHVVKFWHQHSGSREEQLIKIIDDFNATNEYGIVIEATNEGGYGDIYDKMIAGLTTGDVPGLVVAYQNQAASYQVAEGLTSLDPYINDPFFGLSEKDRGDFFQAFLNADKLPQFDGQSYGFPPNRSMEVMYYNATWLAELGYDGPPSTPEEFAEMACAASENPFSQNPDPSTSLGYQVRTDASSVAALTFARGEDIYDYGSNSFTYNNDATAAALTQMANLFAEGCVGLIAERFGDQTDFGNGQTLFTMGSSSGLPFYGSAVDDGEAGGFEWSVAPIPYTGANPVQNIYGASVSIPVSDDVTQLGAWVFLKYYTSPEVQAGWAQASNYFPTRASVADGLGDYFGENPAYEVAFDLLQYGKTEAPVAGYDNVRDEAAAAFSRILDGEDAATVLAELDEAANQILAEAAP